MTQSILLTVKKMLGIAEEYHAFDLDIIIHINSAFLTLNQLGVGPNDPFQIIDETEIWSDFVDVSKVPGVQTYVYLKTRLAFDPPTNSFLVDAIQKQIAELEWRMNVQVESRVSEEEPTNPIEPPDDSGNEFDYPIASDEDVNDMLDDVFGEIPPIESESIASDEDVNDMLDDVFGKKPNESEIVAMSLFSASNSFNYIKPTERAIDKLLRKRREATA